MASLRTLIFFCLAIAMVYAAETERVKKDVVVGALPYAYSGLGAAAYVPTAYSAGAYPYAYNAYHAGAYHTGYPYAGYPAAYRSVVY